MVNAIDYLYPDWSHLLCIWHINQAVIKYCKKLFVRPDKKKAKRNRTESEQQQDQIEEENQQKAFKLFYSDWHYIIMSPSEAEYEQRWADFVAKYEMIVPKAIPYLEDTWLKFKERFVQYWTNRVFHLNNVATSCAEGAHAYIKRSFNGPAGTCRHIWTNIKRAIEGQLDILTNEISYNQLYKLPFTRTPLYTELISKLSHYALNKIDKQARIAKWAINPANKKPLPICTSLFIQTMGLPCAYQIKLCLETNTPIPLGRIHPFWKLAFGQSDDTESSTWNEPLPIPPIRQNISNPQLIRTNGCVVIEQTQTKALPICSACRTEGHRMNEKACPKRQKRIA